MTNDADEQDLAELGDALVDAGWLPPDAGLAIALVMDGRPDVVATRGLRDRRAGLPVTERTVFEVASLTKTLTAATVVAAAQDGHWTLETPFAALAGTALGSGPEGSTATLEDLLCHRAGLAPHEPLWYFADPDAGLGDLVARLGRLQACPGAFRGRFSYSNLGYAALALPFEARLGERWVDYARRRILAPLGMHDSSFGPITGERDVAVGGWGERTMARKDVGATVAAGGLRTSARDLARWLRWQIGADGDDLLTAASRAAMHTQRSAVAEKNPVFYQGIEAFTATPGYALGWFVGEAAGQPFLFHPAYVDGFSAMVALVPARGLGVAVMTNQNISAAPGLATHHIVARAIGLPAVLARAPEPPAPAVTAATAAPIPTGWRGRFDYPAYGAIALEAAGSEPVIRYHGHVWPVRIEPRQQTGTAITATADIVMFGVPFPFAVTVTEATVTLPLAMDPRAEPVVFDATS